MGRKSLGKAGGCCGGERWIANGHGRWIGFNLAHQLCRQVRKIQCAQPGQRVGSWRAAALLRFHSLHCTSADAWWVQIMFVPRRMSLRITKRTRIGKSLSLAQTREKGNGVRV